jgi:hypothetical protein
LIDRCDEDQDNFRSSAQTIRTTSRGGSLLTKGYFGGHRSKCERGP